LPQYTKHKAAYVQQKPAFVLAWLKDFLSEEFKKKEAFLQDFAGDLVPTNFSFAYEPEKFEITLRLLFELDKE